MASFNVKINTIFVIILMIYISIIYRRALNLSSNTGGVLLFPTNSVAVMFETNCCLLV